MVYVDPLLNYIPSAKWPFNQACHLFADSDAELHEFALRLGLIRSWHQKDLLLSHYDLTKTKRKLAVKMGALEVSLEFVGKAIQERKKKRLEALGYEHLS